MNRFFVYANDDEARLLLMSFYSAAGGLSFDSISCVLNITSSGDYRINYKNNTDNLVSLNVVVFDISNGFYITSNYTTLSSGVSGAIPISSYLKYPSCQVFGLSVVNNYNYNLNLPKVL